MSAVVSSRPEHVSIDALIASELAPRVAAIDLEGEYPEAFLRALGGLGGLGAVVPPAHGGSGTGLVDTIATMAKRCQSELALLPQGCRRFINPHRYKVSISAQLKSLRCTLIEQATTGKEGIR